MNIESVKSLFTLFSGEEDCEKYMPIINLALTETKKMLVSTDYAEDIRVEFLCAAIANYRLRQLEAACDRSEYTYAGKLITSPDNGGALHFASLLLSDYISMCEGLIKPSGFTFISFCSETEGLYNA